LQAVEIEKSFTLGQDVTAQQAPGIENGDTLILLYDGHGSTRARVTEAATVVQTYAYDAYGNMLPGVGLTVDAATALTRYFYTAREFDVDTALQYHRNRWYHSNTGRWLSEDPLSFAGGM